MPEYSPPSPLVSPDAPTAKPTPVLERFEAQVTAKPAAVAVVFGQQEVTYSQLNQRANRLAHRLLRLGVGSGALVGLFVERSIDAVVGVLAILKTGAAYVPIDPACPPQRVAFLLDDAGVAALLTHAELLASLPEKRPPTILLDEPDLAPEADRPDEGNPTPRATPDDLAYAIYTSGSTGTPKGVLVTHANLARLFDATACWFCFGPDDVWTLFHSIAFDFSVWEFWGALVYGGRLVVVPYASSRSPQEFYRLLIARRVTVLNQTPSAFRQLIRAEEILGVAPNLALRVVIFGGEALEPLGLRPWFDRHGDQSPRLVNMYGITETTVHVTYRPMSLADLDLSGKGSPIGVPIPDLTVHVLDENLRPVPPGTPGEMCVGGAGVARGYLNRPELTAQRFIADPFLGGTGRLYRSGDRAILQPDGQLEFLGRLDDQVKIRGFRIELGEVESALARLPGVRESVVLVREDVPGERRLVAYVSRGSTPTESATLRTALRATLPDYMVPAAVVLLDQLPLNPNGKIDRAALPAPEALAPRRASTAPATDLERSIQTLWADALRCEVGLDDNFFDLGGTSMHLAEIHAGLQKVLGHDLPVTDLFEHSTVRTLAGHLAGAVKSGRDRDLAMQRAQRQRQAFARQKPPKEPDK